MNTGLIEVGSPDLITFFDTKKMENPLDGLGKNDLGLTILTTIFRVLILLLLTLFKTLSFNVIKKD